MFRNVYYNTKKNQIHIWEEINGERLYDIIDWCPYLFVRSKEKDADVKTIYGKYAKKKIFNTYYNYSDFQKNNKDNPDLYENEIRNEIQFLAERYYGIPDEDIQAPNLLIYYIDIEVYNITDGFPDIKNPQDPITLISVRNGKTKKTITFGCDPISNRVYTGNKNNIKYIKCNDEEELLKRFFAYLHKFPCDVLSGFNIYSGFDLPYTINRSKVLFGEEMGARLYKRMSPINIVNVWKQRNSDDLNIDIAGMTILDYIDLYKKYGKKLERYSLEYISQKELKVGKLKSKYGSINEQIEKDWNEHIEYNAMDCERVNDLEEELGYIGLVQALSLLCKVPMKYYVSQTQLIEGLLLTYFRRNGLCAPNFKGGEQKTFPAAYVKEPQIGLHKWVVDIDITSSYPSHMIVLNISPEKYFGKILRLQEEQVVSYIKKRKFPEFKMVKEERIIALNDDKLKKFNIALKKGLFSIAPNGSIFLNNEEGIVPKIERYIFFTRKKTKGKMKKFELENNKEETKKLDAIQLALKLCMNSFFGIFSVPYSRYCNINLATAITSSGRRTIKNGEKFCNDLLNNPNDKLKIVLNEIDDYKENIDDSKDFIIYIDTDSLFLNLGEFILDNINNKDKWVNLSDKNKIKYIKRISKIIEEYVDDRIFNETQLGDYNSQVKDFTISFKQEIIAKTMLAIKKKKYAYWLLDKEGISKDEVKVTGLELVRSETAEEVRPRLKEILEMIIKQKSKDDIVKTVKKYQKELKQLDPEALAANIGIKGIKKYLGKGYPIKGTPWHVKGVWGYRLLLKKIGLQNKYEDIKEGLKVKVIYVKKNPFNIETIAFYNWPKEFDDIIQMDTEKMIEKFFIKKIRFLLTPIGKDDILDGDMRGANLFFGK